MQCLMLFRSSARASELSASKVFTLARPVASDRAISASAQVVSFWAARCWVASFSLAACSASSSVVAGVCFVKAKASSTVFVRSDLATSSSSFARWKRVFRSRALSKAALHSAADPSTAPSLRRPCLRSIETVKSFTTVSRVSTISPMSFSSISRSPPYNPSLFNNPP